MNQMYKLVAIGILLVLGIGYFLMSGGDNAAVISNLEEREPATAAGYTIIAFGDSLTAGYGLTTFEAYPAQLEAKLKAEGYSVRVINAGVSGETTRGNLERAEFIAGQNPDIVILGIGGNDALRLLPVADTEKNLRDTISTLLSGDTPPVVALLQMQAPLTAGLGYKRQFDALFETLAEEFNLILIPFLTAELFFDSANKLDDGIHYNQIGYAKAVELYIAPEISKILERFE